MKSFSKVSHGGMMRPLLRSLLQKAVRRGYSDLSEKVAFVLAESGDSGWVNARASVIVFEECWSFAGFLDGRVPSVVALKKVALASKNKDAAGLGSMAHAFLEGDYSVFKYVHDPLAVKIVVAGIKRPEAFFEWALESCSNEAQSAVVVAARRNFSRASWPWDKAFMIAGAYLGCQREIPTVSFAEDIQKISFPYWTAVDKHTPQGKRALSNVASMLKISELKLQWVSFYFESVKNNAMDDSPWWMSEINWRFDSLGLSLLDAEDMWEKASPYVQRAVEKQSDSLFCLMEPSAPTALL